MKLLASGNVLYPVEMHPTDPAFAKALAVALVAVSKSVAALSPDFRRNLVCSLASAERAGVPSDELALLRLLVQSAVATDAGPTDPPV